MFTPLSTLISSTVWIVTMTFWPIEYSIIVTISHEIIISILLENSLLLSFKAASCHAGCCIKGHMARSWAWSLLTTSKKSQPPTWRPATTWMLLLGTMFLRGTPSAAEPQTRTQPWPKPGLCSLMRVPAKTCPDSRPTEAVILKHAKFFIILLCHNRYLFIKSYKWYWDEPPKCKNRCSAPSLLLRIHFKMGYYWPKRY